jgi:hypothetical protein
VQSLRWHSVRSRFQRSRPRRHPLQSGSLHPNIIIHPHPPAHITSPMDATGLQRLTMPRLGPSRPGGVGAAHVGAAGLSLVVASSSGTAAFSATAASSVTAGFFHDGRFFTQALVVATLPAPALAPRHDARWLCRRPALAWPPSCSRQWAFSLWRVSTNEDDSTISPVRPL